ncbi:hypothetical protein [Streptomyces mirabilis]|uniref:hypothetical protein n=1 Tax=Streptomyces mirabilis TaxID=68239 RepID=UPI0022535DF0|nr:hypothetical protein [Streptomyces mirabilis]MCX4431435.1 hypothetical protein [Streptomyces mirabilis]
MAHDLNNPYNSATEEAAVVDQDTKSSDVVLSDGVKLLLLVGAFVLMLGAAYGVAAAVEARAKDVLSQLRASEPLPWWAWPVTVGVVAFFIAAAAWAGLLWWKEQQQEAERERRILESAADRLREKMSLPSLVDFNQVLLDQYHGIATDQATKAYRSSRRAMNVGIVILVVAFFAGWRYNTQGDRVFLGSVAAVGAAFTAYLSRTYMKTYERALQQLNQYFNQPVLNGYFLTAERIAESLPTDRKEEVLERIVDDVLESGKEMHRNATGVNSVKATAPKPRRRRRAAQPDAQVPVQPTE